MKTNLSPCFSTTNHMSSQTNQWLNLIPCTQFFGTYTQSTLDAVYIASFKPTRLRVRVDGLYDGTVRIIVQESLKNEDFAYVDSATPTLTFSNSNVSHPMSQTQIQKMNLVGNWMRVKIEIAFSSEPLAVSLQLDVSSS